MYRFGLLGAGRIGNIHAFNLRRHQAAELVSIFDLNKEAAQALATKTRAQVSESPEELLSRPDIDAVIIATPAETHADFITLAAKHGKAIFCEKPIDKDLVKTNECVRFLDQNRSKLFLAFHRRFDRSFARLKQQLSSGEIGAVEAIFLTSRDPYPPSLPYIGQSGGLFRDMMIHDFDIACWLLEDQPVEVYAVGGCFADPAIAELGFLDTGLAMLTTKAGVLVSINCAMRATYGYDQRVEVNGSAGKLEIYNRFDDSVWKSDASGIHRSLPHHFFAERYEQAYISELDYFIDCLASDAPFEPGPDAGLRALQLAEAAHRSWREKRPVRISEL